MIYRPGCRAVSLHCRKKTALGQPSHPHKSYAVGRPHSQNQRTGKAKDTLHTSRSPSTTCINDHASASSIKLKLLPGQKVQERQAKCITYGHLL